MNCPQRFSPLPLPRAFASVSFITPAFLYFSLPLTPACFVSHIISNAHSDWDARHTFCGIHPCERFNRDSYTALSPAEKQQKITSTSGWLANTAFTSRTAISAAFQIVQLPKLALTQLPFLRNQIIPKSSKLALRIFTNILLMCPVSNRIFNRIRFYHIFFTIKCLAISIVPQTIIFIKIILHVAKTSHNIQAYFGT